MIIISTKRLFLAVVMTLMSNVIAARPVDLQEKVAEASAAYRQKDYDISSRLYLEAINDGQRSFEVYYNASCSFALLGNKNKAFELLRESIRTGLSDLYFLNGDTDLAALRGDERWKDIIGEFYILHPEARYFELMMDQTKPVVSRYLKTKVAIDGGMEPPARKVSPFLDFYSNMASFSGDYDVANRNYFPIGPNKAAPADYSRVAKAGPEILKLAKTKKAVFFNESHARSQTRAAIAVLLKPLRNAGFTHLALETIGTEKISSASGGCTQWDILDRDLQSRGYLTTGSGYYTNDPLYSDMVKSAIHLGFQILGYEAIEKDTVRDEQQAMNLACVMKQNPDARLLVIAGFGHISEKKENGMMAYHFKSITGIDPLTIDTTRLMNLDANSAFYGHKPLQDSPVYDSNGGGFVLLNKNGVPLGDENSQYDVLVHVVSESNRNVSEKRSWLELGGVRHRYLASSRGCVNHYPCIVEARVLAEPRNSIPADRCVVNSVGDAGCTLFLRKGEKYKIEYLDSDLISNSEKIIGI